MSESANRIYLILISVFITSLIVSNLIFQKFFGITVLGVNFELSAGILFYPITFLVTDLVSEIYGAKKANQMVFIGVIASLFCLLIVSLANLLDATSWSPVDNEIFKLVFGNTSLAVGASMIAYLCAQFIDIRIYHFWKQITNNKHMWLRNNFSTICSQIIDTFLIIFLLCSGGAIEWSKFQSLFFQGFLFKMMIALIDTPIIYLCTYYLRKKLNLSFGQEIK